MRYGWIGRFFFWLALLVVLALGLAIVAQLGLETLGFSRADAVVVSLAAGVSVAIAAADVFTPIGSNLTTGDFDERTPWLLGTLAVGGVVGGLTCLAARILGRAGVPMIGGQTVPTFLGVALGYVSFVFLNREQYLGGSEAS
ncbi:MAG: hypothetical protein ABEJ71_02190 [Halodesulfurarchaeum sp.]